MRRLEVRLRSIPIKVWVLSIAILLGFVLVRSVETQSFEFPEYKIVPRWLIFAFVIFPLLILLHRTILIEQVKRWMYGHSEDVESELPSVLNSPERPAPNMPTIDEVDMKDVLPHQIEQREKIVKQALIILKRRWRTGFVASLVYVTLPFLMGLLSHKKPLEAQSFVIFITAIYFLFTSLSYFVNQLDFLPKHESFGSILPQFRLAVVITKLFTNPRLDIVLWFYLGGTLILSTIPSQLAGDELIIEDTSLAFFLGVCIAVAIHFGLLVKLWLASHEGPNIKLLVLRVFGSSRSAVLTFDKLIRYWRRFGLHFTMDDPDFAAHRFRIFQNRTLIEISVFIIVTLASEIALKNQLLATGVFLAMVGYDWQELIKRRPVRDQEHARQRIQNTLAKPRHMDGTFKDLRMPAYMNTWKLVVDEFIKVADVVLFDLREYSAQRAGAQYEVDFVFDTYPVHRIVFLRTANSDKEAIHRLLQERWTDMREGSPNISIPNPIIRIYVSDKQKGPDVQGLMDFLLTAPN